MGFASSFRARQLPLVSPEIRPDGSKVPFGAGAWEPRYHPHKIQHRFLKDTAVPTRVHTNQPVTTYSTGVSWAITSGALVGTSASPSTAGYYFVDSGSSLIEIGCVFQINYTTGGDNIVLGLTSGAFPTPFPDFALHVVLGTNNYSIDIISGDAHSGPTVHNIAGAAYAALTSGTIYVARARISGDGCIVDLPNGTQVVAEDTRFGDYPAFQALYEAGVVNTSSSVRFHSIWAN